MGPLLSPADGAPVRGNGVAVTQSPFLLIGDHAGHAIPAALGTLGLGADDRMRHIALDLGIRELGLAVGELLEAPFLWQHFSRLVCDCNRAPAAEDWAAPVSDGTKIPGNIDLVPEARQQREDEIFAPYHRAISAALDQRAAASVPTALIALHSFTPRMRGQDRPWEIGILHDGHEDELARRVLQLLRAVPGLIVGDNEPYTMDGTDYTVPRHAFARRLPYVEFEVRQDCLADRAGIARMANLIVDVLKQ